MPCAPASTRNAVKLKPNQRESASVQLGFTAREDLLKAYEEFIDFRAEKLAEQLNEFVGLGERRSGGQAPAPTA